MPASVEGDVVRFGLVGTGNWGRAIHGRSLGESTEAELVGVWGRDAGRSAAAAAALGTRSFDDLDDLVDEVDALAFAVPPDVQAPLAARAALRGRHVLLEKPIATSAAAAEELAAAVRASGVASVVFLTLRFVPTVRRWIEACAAEEWYGAWGRMFGAAFAPGSPFDTPWRHEKGGLWDLGPHALSVVEAVLGDVTSVLGAAGGRAGTTHLVLEHPSGATTTLSLTLEAPPRAQHEAFTFWGPGGRAAMPALGPDYHRTAYAAALSELVASVRTGSRGGPCDVRYGAHLVDVLAKAESLRARSAREAAAPG